MSGADKDDNDNEREYLMSRAEQGDGDSDDDEVLDGDGDGDGSRVIPFKPVENIGEGLLLEDLQKSGLNKASFPCRDIRNAERAAVSIPHHVQGYTIPYHDMYGRPVAFYRCRLHDFIPKYKQPKETPNHVYYPRGFLELAAKHKYIILTEGEKKAALAVKLGFPAVAFGGVSSWRTKVFNVSTEDVKVGKEKAKITGANIQEESFSPLAVGMPDLIAYAVMHDKALIIIYDHDEKETTNFSVQAAAANLGYELRHRGVPFKNIRQISLEQLFRAYTSTTPTTIFSPRGEARDVAKNSKDTPVGKVVLDDFLLMSGAPELLKAHIDLALENPSCFPRHPNPRAFLNKKLQSVKLSRQDMQLIATAVLAELDADGTRIISPAEENTYYFNRKTHDLIKVNLKKPEDLPRLPFGQFLYKTYGIGTGDFRVIQWLANMYTGEEPVAKVTPYRILARPEMSADSVIFQISDAEYVKVTADEITIHTNGSNGIMFESGHTKPLDKQKLLAELDKQRHMPILGWWMDVLNDVRLRDKEKQRFITALLFYVSPWLYRWRGTQLPIEMTLGEAGSGKSTLQELRLMIQTGNPSLRNAPTDMRDWHASVANTGGLHVTDNVQLGDKNLRQKLSDEVCRIITELDPHIEMRRMYTEAELFRLPVQCVFSVTAISQPFMNSDILQRSIIIELDKAQDYNSGALSYDMNWKDRQLQRFGGREAWIAHHLLVLHKFFILVREKWNHRYQAKHRLINFEQAMMTMAQVFGIPPEWIPAYLNGLSDRAVVEADWAFEGIQAFCQYWEQFVSIPLERVTHPESKQQLVVASKRFTVAQISEWAQGSEEFSQCDMLTNTRKLGKYIKTHQTMISTVTRMISFGTYGNRQQFAIEAKR